MLLTGNTNEQIAASLDIDSGEVEKRLDKTVQSIRSNLDDLL
jgi:DNA-directed RNA polymerase specialized sigma24 family protein